MKLTPEQIDDIKGRMADFFERTKTTVIPDDQYQELIRAGHPLVCAKWDLSSGDISSQVFQNERLRIVIRGRCAICKEDISMAELNKDATFPICIECFIEYRGERP